MITIGESAVCAAAGDGRIAEARETLRQRGVGREHLHRLPARRLEPLQRRDHAGQLEDVGDRRHAQVGVAGDAAERLQAVIGSGDARQVGLEQEAGGIEDEIVVLLGAQVFAVEVLVRGVLRRSVPGPLELLEIHRVEQRPPRHGRPRPAAEVRVELQYRLLPECVGQLLVVHQLAAADAAVAREPEAGDERGRHAIGRAQGDAVGDATPAAAS
jgi:hypothetical protein